jgi:protein Tex
VADEARGALDESRISSELSIDLGQVARELHLPVGQVQRTLELLDEGNTVPFITRYRKDQTGALDDEQIRLIQLHAARQRALAERKQTILKSIEAQGKLMPELARDIAHAHSTKRLEDLYLPFKPKKQTLATLARQRGLEPLALELLAGQIPADEWERRAEAYIDESRELRRLADVTHGVRHLLAESYCECVELRDRLRKQIRQSGKLVVSRLETPRPEIDTPAERPADMRALPAVPAPPHPAEPPATAAEWTGSEPTEPEVRPDEEPANPCLGAEAETPRGDREQGDGGAESKEAELVATVESSDAVPPGIGEHPAQQDIPANQAGPACEEVSAIQEGLVDEESPVDQEVSPGQAGSASQEGSIDQGGSIGRETAVQQKTAVNQKAVGSGPKGGGRNSKSPAPARNAKKQKKRQKLEAAFKDYFRFSESLNRLPPHRVLAINRGERARILRVKLELNFEELFRAATFVIAEDHPQREFLLGCLRDALQRLILPSLEREARRELTEAAEEHAVEVFIRNLRKLLLQPPVRNHRILAVDPGFRSGCKLIALDQFGSVVGHDLIHVVGREERKKEGRERLVRMIQQHQLSVVAIGNGTGCREAEQLVADVLAQELADTDVAYVVVNEAGASVYSTSPLGREELPQFDPVLRSAISIGRRLLDPLSELVKINPANIGVGLYQHDVKAKHLRDSLDAVVESCVNFVGVDVNTASPALLRYVSGLNQLTARRLYEYRLAHGPFQSRDQFQQVPGFGEQTFVQSAGFLKIAGGQNPLDATWIHPESYPIARQVLQHLGEDLDILPPPHSVGCGPPASPHPPVVETTVSDDAANASSASPAELPPAAETSVAVADALPPPGNPDPLPPEESVPVRAEVSVDWAARRANLARKVAAVELNRLAESLGVGELLLRDIVSSLTRPERDPRDDLPPPVFRRGIMKLEDLRPGMELSGTVLNVVDFGAFMDIGLTESGLVHISRLADRFIRDPHEVVGVGDTLKVWVLEVDKQRRRVSLTAVPPGAERRRPEPREAAPRGTARPPAKRPAGTTSPPARRDKSKRPAPAGKGRTWTSKPAKAAPPLTKAMEDGKEPLRSFSDLLQYYEKKSQGPNSPDDSTD